MNSMVWSPAHPEQTQMAKFMAFATQKHQRPFANYQQLHTWSVDYPQLFWPTLCDFFNITFDTPPTAIISSYEKMIEAQWFVGASLNFAQKILSRQDDHPALITINENNDREMISYRQLTQKVAECAAGLAARGVTIGDRVAGVMPNTAHTIIAMLATTSLGAIWSSCSPDFGAQAAIDRLGQVKPKCLFICDGHQYQGKTYSSDEKITQLIQSMPSLEVVIISPNIHQTRPVAAHDKVLYWDEFILPAHQCHFVSLPFNHPIYILFSSGTTGKPKCIIHGAGTLLQHIKELGLHSNLGTNDNLCFYTTCGWMMWNWMVSSLALGATLTLYEGSPTYPNYNRLFELITEERITIFGTSAKFLSAVEKMGATPGQENQLTHLKCILSTGSPLLPQNYDFVYHQIKSDIQLSSISGGTDIISCFALGNPMLPVYRGELQCLGLGMGVEVFNEQGQSVRGQRGELVCTKPFPSMPIGFLNDKDNAAYHRAYFEHFPEVWTHGDFAEVSEHGGLIIYGRSDAVLNPGGVRIGTAEIYRQVETIDAVLESVVIGQEWEEDTRIILFVKLKPHLQLDNELIKQIKATIRKNASPRHVPEKILQVADIPRTINGKIVEIAVRQAVHQQAISNLQSLINPEALAYFKNRPELLEDID